MPGHSGPWRKNCWLIRERVLCLEQPACNAASMPLCSLGLSVLHVKHVGQRCHYCRPELPWTHVARRTCGVKKNTHTAVHRTQPCRTGGSSACAGQLVSKGWASNFTCAHRAAPAPAAAARRPEAGAPARRHATSSRGQDRHRSSGLASALAWVSSGAFFSQASARPSLTASWALGCPVRRVRVIGRKTCSHCDLPPRPPQQLHRRARWRAATAVLRPTCTAGAPAPAAAQRDWTGLSSSGRRAVRVRLCQEHLLACLPHTWAGACCLLARPGASPGAQPRARARPCRDLHALRAPPTHARPAARRTRCTTTLSDRSRCVLLVCVQPRYLSSLLAARTGPGERPTRRACICTQVALSIIALVHAPT